MWRKYHHAHQNIPKYDITVGFRLTINIEHGIYSEVRKEHAILAFLFENMSYKLPISSECQPNVQTWSPLFRVMKGKWF